MCVCLCVCLCVHAYLCVCVHMHVHTCVCMRAHVHMSACVCVYVCMCLAVQVVEMISTDLQPADSPPFYSLVGAPHEPAGREGKEEGWAEEWRSKLQLKDRSPVPLPTPGSKMYYADLRTLLKLPTRQLAPLHRYMYVHVSNSLKLIFLSR